MPGSLKVEFPVNPCLPMTNKALKCRKKSLKEYNLINKKQKTDNGKKKIKSTNKKQCK